MLNTTFVDLRTLWALFGVGGGRGGGRVLCFALARKPYTGLYFRVALRRTRVSLVVVPGNDDSSKWLPKKEGSSTIASKL